MQFFYNGKMYKIARVTGPTHNILGLVLEKNGCADDPEIRDVSCINTVTISPKSKNVKNQVLNGLAQANKELSVNFSVKEIEFSGNDTPSENIYSELTKEIIRRVIFGNS